MALGNQSIDKTKIARGHVRLRLNSNSSNPVPTVVSRVASVDKIDMAEGDYEHVGWNQDGTSQIAAVFETKQPTGIVELTLDQIQDLDATTIFGNKTDLDLCQAYPDGTLGWRLYYPKARVVPVDMTPSFDKPTTQKVKIIPYNDPGTAPWQFDPAYSAI